MWRAGLWGGWRSDGWYEDRHGHWRESVWRRSMRRAGTGAVLLGLALLVRSTLGILSADADERVRLPDGSVIGELDVRDWRDLPDNWDDGPQDDWRDGWQERLAAGQPLPPRRPPGLFLKTLYPSAEPEGGAPRARLGGQGGGQGGGGRDASCA